MSNLAVSEPTRWPHRLALAGVIVLTVGLRFYGLEQVGFGNLYYAAAVKSMLQSWHNFFFVAFDPAGFVSVDKPPLGLWVQALSARLLGFSGWSLLFPQALAGVLSVLVLYRLVRRAWGPTAGVLAALALALTPISVAANRNNTMDSQLVLLSLLAAWAVRRAAEAGRLRWLLLGAVLVGLGFNLKMLQAFMILPALFLLYLAAAPRPLPARLGHLALAGAVLTAVSLSWAVAVDLTPAEARPYVGSSQDNTVMELIVGHNGAARLGQIGALFGIQRGPAGAPGDRIPDNPQGNQPPGNQGSLPPGGQGILPPGAQDNPRAPTGPGAAPGSETGDSGPLRLFNAQLAGQASWLLPLALIGLLAASLRVTWRRPWGREPQALLLWGAWLIPQLIFFSYAGLFHRYYLEMIAPAIAALAGIGAVALWEGHRQVGWRGFLLPAGLLVSALVQVAILGYFPTWAAWLIPPVLGLAICAAAALLAVRGRAPAGALAASLVGGLALLIAPAVWSLTPVLSTGDVALPHAGPELLEMRAPVRLPVARAGGASLPAQNRLVDYLTEQRGPARYLAATLNANNAAPIILATGEPVMALGGFSGSDQILTVDQLSARVQAGEVRFFLLSSQGGRLAPPGGGAGSLPPGQVNLNPGQGANAELVQWVTTQCRAVPAGLWQSPGGALPTPRGPGELQQLYDCGSFR